MSTAKAWEEEYSRQGIPSSFRSEASGSVKYFFEYLTRRGAAPGKALDAGAGRGRNSYFLAEHGYTVEAVDYVEGNITLINSHAAARGLAVRGTRADITQPLPFPDRHFDAAIDIFCYKHVVSKKSQAAYRRELARMLAPGGHLLISLAGDDDGFYGPLIATSPDPSIKRIVDPVAQVESLLYSSEELEDEFSALFDVIEVQKKVQPGPMHGQTYQRSTLLMIARNRGDL